ncbi:hypothetical protein AX15_002893 [Amanita polypyramis BW_CC]|nr:hypothetical protein AX15_002893 [Amanita polypyramis BW_CC]
MTSLLIPILSLFLPLIGAHVHGGGGGTNMSAGADLGMGTLHFKPLQDTLWFQGWAPISPGAIVGACIGLFLLAVFERWLVAGRAIAERSWNRTAQLVMLERMNQSKDTLHHKQSSKPTYSIFPLRDPHIPPFILSHDISRGILHAVQRLLTYLLMLAVMTFQVSFIISIIVGAGIGEVMFGRYISGGAGH